MRSSRVWAVALVMLALSCGRARPEGPSSHGWVAPAILAHVPADTPYLVASLAPIDDRLRQRMLRGVDKRVAELMRSADQLRAADRATLEPWARGGLALADELRGTPPAQWWRQLGFAPGGRFVVYGLSVWPVLRVELADPARLRGVIDRVLSAAGTQPRQATLAGRAYWIASLRDLTLVAAVLDHEAVVAIVPTPALATALPLVLATREPARSLRSSSTVRDLLGRHHFMDFTLAYLDLRRTVELITAPVPTALEAPLRTSTGPISPACHADLGRLVAVAPRVVFGYRRLDEAGFAAAGIVEAPASVLDALKRLRTPVPEVTSPFAGRPLFALGAAVKPGELVTWLRGVTDQLQSRPFTCPRFAGLNRLAGELAPRLAAPLPEPLRRVRGFSLVVDDLTISPLNVNGHLLIVGDHTAELVASLARVFPPIAATALKPDGRPVPLPVLGLPTRSAHLAMTAERLVITSGPASEQRAQAHLASPVPRSSPLVMTAFNAPRLRALTAALGQDSTDDISYLGNAGMSLDVAADGLRLDVWGTWDDAPALAVPQPVGRP